MNKRNKKCLKTIWQKTAISFMALALFIVLMPLTTSAANVTTGTIGDNDGITWTYDGDTDTLTLSGEDSGSWGVDAEDTFYKVSVLREKCPNAKKILVDDLTIVGDASYFFAGFENVESIKFKKVDTSQVTNMNGMFQYCRGLKGLDLSGFDTSSVTNMQSMFLMCAMINVNLSSFNTANVKNFSQIFMGCYNLTSLDVTNFDTSNAFSIECMFAGCTSLTSLDVSNFDTSNVSYMYDVFGGCSGLTSLDVSNFDTSNVFDMSLMFIGCSGLTSLDLSNFQTSRVGQMCQMFDGCSKLTTLDISGFSLSSIRLDDFIPGNENMFRGCYKLKTIQTPKVIPQNLEVKLADVYLDEAGNKHSALSSAVCATTLTQEPNPFSDVQESGWQYAYVKFALNNNLMKGKDTDANGNIIFDPDKEMTRAEFVQALYNKEGKPAVTYTDKFPDVAEGKWYTNAILWAAENNIVAGKGNGNFDVSGNITRQEMATILYKYANYKQYNTVGRSNLDNYTDASSVSSWAVENMKWALYYGVMKGKGDRLAPLENATRAECATMLCNFMSYYEGY